MLSLEEIRKTKINREIAERALSESDRRLADTLDTKKAFEQKAATLFAAYVALSLALFGIGATVYKAQGGFTGQAMAFLIVGFLFMGGALFFIFALLDKEYGARGSMPDMWLVSGTIDGDEHALNAMLAYLTHHHQQRIAAGVENNETKASLVRRGVQLGVVGPFLLLILLIFS